MNPNAVNNLPKDENGNILPGPGRPDGTGFRDAIAKLGAELTEAEGRKLSKIEASVLASFKLAMEGDTTAIKFLAQHLEGTKQDIESGGKPLQQSVVVYLPDNGRNNTQDVQESED
jgi:hypothetical protein